MRVNIYDASVETDREQSTAVMVGQRSRRMREWTASWTAETAATGKSGDCGGGGGGGRREALSERTPARDKTHSSVRTEKRPRLISPVLHAFAHEIIF